MMVCFFWSINLKYQHKLNIHRRCRSFIKVLQAQQLILLMKEFTNDMLQKRNNLQLKYPKDNERNLEYEQLLIDQSMNRRILNSNPRSSSTKIVWLLIDQNLHGLISINVCLSPYFLLAMLRRQSDLFHQSARNSTVTK